MTNMVIDTYAVIVYDDMLLCQLGLIKTKKRLVYIVILVTPFSNHTCTIAVIGLPHYGHIVCI